MSSSTIAAAKNAALRKSLIAQTPAPARIPVKPVRAAPAKFLKNKFGNNQPNWYGKSVSSNLRHTHNLLSSWRKTVTGLMPLLYSVKTTPQHVWLQADNIGKAIVACTLSKPCKSSLCPACRTRKQDTFVLKNIERFKSYNQKDVYFLTILFPIKANPHVTVPQIIEQERKQLQQLVYQARIDNSDFDDVMIAGAFEVDIKQKHNITQSASIHLLQKLGMSFGANAGSAFLVHVHALVYSAGLSQQRLRKIFADHYSIKKQVQLKKLYSSNSLIENINTVSTYMLKTRTSYAVNLYASNKTNYKRVYSNGIYDQEDLVQYAVALDLAGSVEFVIKAKK